MRPSKANATSRGTRGLVVAALLVLSPFLAQCDRERAAPEARPVPSQAEPPPSLPAPAPALDRAGLIAAAELAAGAYAAGQAPDGGDPLVGRAFVVRSAFGCGTLPEVTPAPAAPGDGLARAVWGAAHQTIQLSLAPGDWAGSALLAGPSAKADWEAVEGLWLARPWLRAEGCSAVRADPLQARDGGVASPQTLGLAAVFGENASRLGRRNGRAYAFTVRASGDAAVAPPADGYRLVLEGRLVGFPDGRAFHCHAPGPDRRPVCIAAVRLGRVAFALPEGQVLSEWRGG
jgi:hypothetical protein